MMAAYDHHVYLLHSKQGRCRHRTMLANNTPMGEIDHKPSCSDPHSPAQQHGRGSTSVSAIRARGRSPNACTRAHHSEMGPLHSTRHVHGHGEAVHPVQGQHVALAVKGQGGPVLGVVALQPIWRLLPPGATVAMEVQGEERMEKGDRCELA